MKKLFNAFIITLSTAAFVSCGTSSTKDPALVLDSLQSTYRVINDSLSRAWTVMIEDDDQKLAYMKRLLQEVEYTNSYHKDTLDALGKRVDDAIALRYDRETMSNSDLIDEYDAVISNLMFDVTNYARSNPLYEKFPLMAELITDIQTADGRVLFHRVHYDNYAKLYNQFVTENTELLEQIDSEMNSERLPLFELSQ